MSGVAAGLIWSALIIVLWWIGKRKGGRASAVAPDRPELGYSVYTSDFDCEIEAADWLAQIVADGDDNEIARGDFERDIEKRRAIYIASLERSRNYLKLTGPDLRDRAICLLLDLSGSMAGRIPSVLGDLRAVAEWCRDNGARVAVFGFTTRGWQGGFPREIWTENGRPDYPGRLCALMHVRITDFDGSDHDESWEALLDPRVLRENVDGEALRWAASSLLHIDAARRTLIVISDGAPVDDSTIVANGNGYLSRDLHAAIAEIGRMEMIDVHGVGLLYWVDDYYSSAYHVDGEGGLVESIEQALAAGEFH